MISIIAMSVVAVAQGNLQFNQVKRLTYSGSLTVGTNTVSSVTVPANKVWKIESGSITSNDRPFYYFNLMVDGQILWAQATSGVVPVAYTPIWLGAGTYNISANNAAGSAYPYNVVISAIEFNVIP